MAQQTQATIIAIPKNVIHDDDKIRIEKLFPKKTIKILSVFQLVNAALAAIFQVSWHFFLFGVILSITPKNGQLFDSS